MRLVILAFLLVIYSATGCAATLVKEKNEWRLALCYGKTATENDLKYRHAIGQSASAAIARIDTQAETVMKVRQCVKEPDLACYADSSAIFCREEPLAQLARTAAWLASERAFIYLSVQGQESSLQAVPALSWSDAYLMADAERYEGNERMVGVAKMIADKRGLNGESLDSLHKLALDVHKHVNNQEELDERNAPLNIALGLYEDAMAYAMSFLVGHEAYHFNGNNCHVKQESVLKEQGVWDVVKGLQQKNGLYDRKNRFDIDELNADLCGYRWLEVTTAALNKENSNAVFNALSKKVALDLMASPLLVGLNGSVGSNEDRKYAPKVKVSDGYLYPQSRLILASAVLRLSEKNYRYSTKLCNDTAKAIVTIIQDAVASYPKSSGIVPDEVLIELPKGVEVAWNGGRWSEDSYACLPGGK